MNATDHEREAAVSPTIADLLAALPEDDAHEEPAAAGPLQELCAALARTPTPTGSLRRLWALGGLQAQIAFAYVAYWLRGWVSRSDEQQQRLLDTQLRVALRVLGTMGYLRGAVMKVGQMLASYPGLVPDQFADLLATLHFQAPPMHFSLLREQVRDELGKDPEDLFESFETTAFAAASLGQVHRARLKSGESVAVKIQYPGIGRAVRADLRNLRALMAPLRWSKDGDNMREQLDYIGRVLEDETDYEREAEFQRKTRALFAEDDGLVVPRVHDAYSTRRVLTSEYLDGVHLPKFLDSNPSQELRNHFGEKLVQSWARLYCSGRMLYSDLNPGNFLFLNDGRLGMLDFGCVRHFSDEEWDMMRMAGEAIYGDAETRVRFVARSVGYENVEAAPPGLLAAVDDFVRWCWEPFWYDGPFEFGNAAKMKEGMDIAGRLTRKRQTRGKPVFVFVGRYHFGYRSLLYRLGARVNMRAIMEREARHGGW
jgi:predicted unusual protein kinase regulating ubiquinone biosynthesis (AarF/ABC1/UbiB family)